MTMGRVQRILHEVAQNDKQFDFLSVLEQFISSQDVTRGSRVTYRNALKQFFNWFVDQKNSTPSRETILQYKEELDLKGLRPSTRASYLVAVRKFFEWAET